MNEVYNALKIMGFTTGETVSNDKLSKRYKELVKVLHPDKSTGDPKRFMEVKKAYDLVKSQPLPIAIPYDKVPTFSPNNYLQIIY